MMSSLSEAIKRCDVCNDLEIDHKVEFCLDVTGTYPDGFVKRFSVPMCSRCVRKYKNMTMEYSGHIRNNLLCIGIYSKKR